MTQKYDRLMVYGDPYLLDQEALGRAMFFYYVIKPDRAQFMQILLTLFPENEQHFTRIISRGRRRDLHFNIVNVYDDIPYMRLQTSIRALLSAFPKLSASAIASILDVDVTRVYPYTKKVGRALLGLPHEKGDTSE